MRSLSFQGVHAVDQSLLKQAIATRENSKVPVLGWELPWSKKHGFDQSRFDADLQRIKGFYADRGYPDAIVTKVAVVPNAKMTAVDVTVTIDEGKPVVVAAVVFSGFDVIPEKHFTALQHDTPLKVGRPRDRQTVVAARELALNELRDHGYPYAAVTTSEDDGPDGRAATVSFTGGAGRPRAFRGGERCGQPQCRQPTRSNASCRRTPAICPGEAKSRTVSDGYAAWSFFSSSTFKRPRLAHPLRPTRPPRPGRRIRPSHRTRPP